MAASDPEPPAAAPRPLWRRVMALGLFAAALAYFLAFFHAEFWQPRVDLSWVVAVAAWLGALWQRDRPSQPRLPQPYWFYALYVAAMLPFATNWRWLMAGDSLGWPFSGLALAERGPHQSFLSTGGVHQFGYLQAQLHNVFMLLISPTMFWHRAGQILVGALALAAIYTAYGRLVSPWFGLLVAACAMTTSVMIVQTYCSYPLIDGIACGYAILAVGLWVRRDPVSQRAWLVLGCLCGFMLFLTPTAWFMALCVAVWLGPQVVWRRWPLLNPLLAGASAVITGLPVLVQWSHGGGGQLFSLVESPTWTAEKLLGFLREAVVMPFASPVQSGGAFGPQLPPGFRWLFIPGIVLTPLFGRRFPGARLALFVYAVHLIILTLGEGPYDTVSIKRALVLIPMATYFVFLPFHRRLRASSVVLPLVGVWASFAAYNLVYRMEPGRTGYTLLDGVVEAHQRFTDAPVCILLSRDYWTDAFAPGSDLDRLVGLSPHVQRAREPTDRVCRTVLCYCPQIDTLDQAALGYEDLPMLNTVELRCGRRLAAARD